MSWSASRETERRTTYTLKGKKNCTIWVDLAEMNHHGCSCIAFLLWTPHVKGFNVIDCMHLFSVTKHFWKKCSEHGFFLRGNQMNIILGRHDISRMVQLPLEKKKRVYKSLSNYRIAMLSTRIANKAWQYKGNILRTSFTPWPKNFANISQEWEEWKAMWTTSHDFNSPPLHHISVIRRTNLHGTSM